MILQFYYKISNKLTKNVIECPTIVFSLYSSFPNLSRRSKITWSKSSRRVLFLSLSSTTWLTISRNFRSTCFGTKLKLMKFMINFNYFFNSHRVFLRNLKKLIQKRHKKNNLLFNAHPKSWFKHFIAHFSKTCIRICERLSIKAKRDCSNIISRIFSTQILHIKFHRCWFWSTFNVFKKFLWDVIYVWNCDSIAILCEKRWKLTAFGFPVVTRNAKWVDSNEGISLKKKNKLMRI